MADEDDGDDMTLTESEVMQLSRFDLQVELQKRNLETTGNKKALRARLKITVRQEKEQKLAYEAMVEARKKAEIDMESAGTVYTVGINNMGQLGTGDYTPRRRFRPVLETRGKGIHHVSSSLDTIFAVAESGDVYSWGGGGVGPLGCMEDEEMTISEKREQTSYLFPTLVEPLKGEGIITLAVGQGHAAAVSDGGDVFVWGDGQYGQLGLGEPLESKPTQQLLDLPVGEYAKLTVTGPSHTLTLCESGRVFAWGMSVSGQLGLGTRERHGVEGRMRRYFPTPTLIKDLDRHIIKDVSCSANHSMALTSAGQVYTWGSADGGRLGHSDRADKISPTLVEVFKEEVVLNISCGYWHSAAIVAKIPLADAGWLYTWGSGYHGQLAQGIVQTCSEPQVVEILLDMNIYARKVFCGSHHCALVTDEGYMYTWGQNLHRELGAGCKKEHTPVPQKVKCFNVIVGRIPRGHAHSIALGRGFTIVATAPYSGMSEGEIDRIQTKQGKELREREAEELAKKQDEFARLSQKNKALAPGQRNGMVCDKCGVRCPGFQGHLLHPHLCKWCGCPANSHNTKNAKLADDNDVDDDDGN